MYEIELDIDSQTLVIPKQTIVAIQSPTEIGFLHQLSSGNLVLANPKAFIDPESEDNGCCLSVSIEDTWDEKSQYYRVHVPQQYAGSLFPMLAFHVLKNLHHLHSLAFVLKGSRINQNMVGYDLTEAQWRMNSHETCPIRKCGLTLAEPSISKLVFDDHLELLEDKS